MFKFVVVLSAIIASAFGKPGHLAPVAYAAAAPLYTQGVVTTSSAHVVSNNINGLAAPFAYAAAPLSYAAPVAKLHAAPAPLAAPAAPLVAPAAPLAAPLSSHLAYTAPLATGYAAPLAAPFGAPLAARYAAPALSAPLELSAARYASAYAPVGYASTPWAAVSLAAPLKYTAALW